MKRIIALFMAIIMLVSTPMELVASEVSKTKNDITFAEDEVLENTKAEGEEYVTRIQWLQALTSAYGMSVEEENYPDNYYSDIDERYTYYYDVMLATEFGLVDVEAGDPFYPDAPATREFVVHTLNACMGFSNEGEEYTFNEFETVQYPKDIQVAIQQGWFGLDENGNFNPEQSVTTTEQEALIMRAQNDAADRIIDENHQNMYELQSDVIAIPEHMQVEMLDEETYVLTENVSTFAAGDKIAFLCFDFPVVKRVTSIENVEGSMIITTEDVDTEDAFVSIDYEGIGNGALAELQVVNEDNVELTYVVGGTAENDYNDGTMYESANGIEEVITAVKVVKSYDVDDEIALEYDLGNGFTLEVCYTISSPTMDYRLNTESPYINFNAQVGISCNATAELVEAVGGKTDVTLVNIPFLGVGFLRLELTFSASGEMSLEITEDVSMGVKWSEAEGLQMTRNFTKQAFTLNAKVKSSVGIQVSIGFDVVIIEGKVYGEVGAITQVEHTQHTDGASPSSCTHITGHLYAECGMQIEIDISKNLKFTRTLKVDIFDDKNSPVKVVFHFEDGNLVSSCSREPERYKYYTSIDSDYADVGANTHLFQYGHLNDGTIEIYGYNGKNTTVIVPRKIDGYVVTQIHSFDSAVKYKIKKIVLPDTVKKIGKEAFSGCSALKVIGLKEGLEEIGEKAFKYCSELEVITLPSSLKTLGASAFIDCTSLKTINIPKSLEVIGKTPYEPYEDGTGTFDGPFAGSGLKTVYFDWNTTQIPECLFAGCDIESISIPGHIKSIGNRAFDNCSSLANVSLLEGIESIGARAFRDCNSLQSLDLPKSLTNMGAYAFMNCVSLRSVTIPKSLKNDSEMDWAPFTGCENLNIVTFETGIERIESELFKDCIGIQNVLVYNTVKEIGRSAFDGCYNLVTATISNGVEEIGDGAFASTGLVSVIVPESVKRIGNGAFATNSLTGISLKEGLESIGNRAFAGTSLSLIVIPSTVTSLGDEVFQNSTVSKITLNEGLQSIGSYAFAGTNITSIDLPEGLQSLGWAVFSECDALRRVWISKSLTDCHVTNIGKNNLGMMMRGGPFYDCKMLSDIEFESGITTIPSELFAGYENLTAITIPETITQIARRAFEGCISLEQIVIPDNVKEIGADAFFNCYSLNKVTLPEGIKTLSDNAFGCCENLYNINLPDSLSSIAYDIFNGTQNVTVRCVKGSQAHAFVRSKNIKYILDEYPITEIILSQTQMNVKQYQEFILTYTTNPVKHTDSVTWSSSDSSIAYVYEDENGNGVVNVYSKFGTATITVTSESGVSASCEITVVPNTHTITYMLNGGTNNPENPDTFSITETVILKEPIRKGYTFHGWYTNEECYGTNNQVDRIKSGTNKDITLYAGWTINEYQIYYGNLNAGGMNHKDNPTSYTVEDENIILKDATWEGYRFLGWYEGGYEGAKQVTMIDTSLAQNVSVHAKWEKIEPKPEVVKEVVITFDVNGGNSLGADAKRVVKIGETVGTLPKPIREGYTFVEWNTKADGTGSKIIEDTKVSSDEVYYAKWKINKYSISFKANGGTGSTKGISNIAYNKEIKLTANGFKRKGYKFTGWNTKANGSGTSYKNKAKVKGLSKKNGAKITLYAQWKPVEYKIAYKLNGGSFSKNQKVAKTYNIKTATIKLSKPTRKNYQFAGWYSDAKFKKKVTNIKKGSTGNKTLYAKWTSNKYSIRFKANGGTGSTKGISNIAFNKTTKLTVNGFKRKGYTFVGWNTKADGSGKFYKNKAKVKGLSKKNGAKVTLYAQWKRNKK